MSTRQTALKRGYPIPTDIVPDSKVAADLVTRPEPPATTPDEGTRKVGRREALAIMAEQVAVLLRMDCLADAILFTAALNSACGGIDPRHK